MKRRTFMAGLVALPAVGGAQASAGWTSPGPVRTLLAITDIGPATVPEALEAVLSGFVAKRVPVHLIVRPVGQGGPELRPENPLCVLLRDWLGEYQGLLELVPFAPDLGRIRPYTTARLAAEARADLVQAIWPVGSRDPALSRIGTIASRAADDPLSVAAVASAGFRTVLAIAAQPAEVIARQSGNQVLSLSGGLRLRLRDALPSAPPVGRASQQLIAFSAREIAAGAAGVLRAGAARFADAILAAEVNQQIAPLRARDLQMRIDPHYRRQIALCLFDDPASPAPGMALLRKALDGMGISYSVGPPLRSVTRPGRAADGYWVNLSTRVLRAGQQPGPPVSLIRRAPGSGPARWEAEEELPPGLAVVLVRDPAARRGLDATASLHVPILALHDGPREAGAPFLPLLDDAENGAVVITAAAVATAAMRSSLLAGISSVSGNAGTAFVPLDAYARRVAPDDGLFPVFMRAEALALRPQPAPVPRAASEREALMQDARAAWRFFEVATHAATGLCASALNYDTSFNTGYYYSTMWDVGSHLNALMAATDLALIGDEDFTKRCTAILRTLDRAARSRLKLPPEEIDSRTGRGTRRFNSYDTGRLLTALDRLRRFRVPVKGIEGLVASWDIPRVLIDGHFHSITGGKLVDDTRSNTSSYAVAGLRAWGYNAVSPFDAMTVEGQADAKIALLAEVAQFGPVGAEPALLHLLDVGHQPAADFLADVLMAAQQEEWAATRRLMAPSETPIDRSPWFTYQGLALDGRADPWAVDADFANDRQKDPAFRNSLRAISSKAAFLWHALRPDAFTKQLLDHVRREARTEFGYKSAVYLTPGMAMENYFDINTSGIILQSVARILEPGRG